MNQRGQGERFRRTRVQTKPINKTKEWKEKRFGGNAWKQNHQRNEKHKHMRFEEKRKDASR